MTRQRAAEMEQAPSRGRGETILLVEDEDSIRTVAQRVLQKWGYAVLAARSSSEGLQMAAQLDGRIHLVVSDLMVPDLSGPAMVALLLESRPGVPVLYLSGYPREEVSQSGLLPAGSILLEKPFGLDVFAQHVREIIDGASPHG